MSSIVLKKVIYLCRCEYDMTRDRRLVMNAFFSAFRSEYFCCLYRKKSGWREREQKKIRSFDKHFICHFHLHFIHSE